MVAAMAHLETIHHPDAIVMTDVTETETDLDADHARRMMVQDDVMREARLIPIPPVAATEIENERTATPDGTAGEESGNGTVTGTLGAMRDGTMRNARHDETVSNSRIGPGDESEIKRESGNADEVLLHHPRRENPHRISQTLCLCWSARGD